MSTRKTVNVSLSLDLNDEDPIIRKVAEYLRDGYLIDGGGWKLKGKHLALWCLRKTLVTNELKTDESPPPKKRKSLADINLAEAVESAGFR